MYKLLGSVCIMFIVLSGCTLSLKTDNISDYVVVKDNGSIHLSGSEYSSKVNLDEIPKNIATLDSFYTDSLTYLGYFPSATITDDYSEGEFPYYLRNNLDEANTVNLGVPENVNMENLEESQPDLILASKEYADDYDELNEIAPTVIWDVKASKDDEPAWESLFIEVSQIVDRESKAQDFINNYNKRLDIANDEIEENHRDDIVVYLTSEYSEEEIEDEAKKYRLIYQSFLYDDLNFSSSVFGDVFEGGDYQIQDVKVEDLKNIAPDYIIFGSDVSIDAMDFEKDELINEIQAYKEDRIITVDPSLWNSHTGPIGRELQLNQIDELLNI